MRTGLLLGVSSLLIAGGLGFALLAQRRASAETARLEALAEDLTSLRAQVAALHAAAASSVERETVLRLIAEDREQQDQAKKKERDRIAEQRSLAWSEQVAKAHGLSDEQRRWLVEVFELQRSRSDEWNERLSSAVPDVDSVNRIYEELVAWRRAELEKRLDAEAALEINRDPFWLAAFDPPGTTSR